ncbi:MAG: glycosyltransferase [Candidatus Phlomobacter fragariae]
MRKENFISIVLPFYNKSELLENFIESIYNQKFKYKLFDLSNTELIFVDNNSTDNSVKKI